MCWYLPHVSSSLFEILEDFYEMQLYKWSKVYMHISPNVFSHTGHIYIIINIHTNVFDLYRLIVPDGFISFLLLCFMSFY